MIKSLSKNIIDVKTFGLAVKTVKSYGQTVWERVITEPSTISRGTSTVPENWTIQK